jgi:hypothetical protein
MSMRRLQTGTLVLALTLAAAAVAADDLADFQAALETIAAYNRTALGYLRTDNVDLALFELDRMHDAWGGFAGRFGKERPTALRDNPLFTSMLVDVPTRIVTAKVMIDARRPRIARDSLLAIRREFSDVRRASHIEVLADCILDANTAMDALMADDPAQDHSTAGTGVEVAAKAKAYADTLARCDRMAPPQIRSDAEFRRLVDGANASLAAVPKAVAAKDSDLLHRLLIELRALDNLLAFRYG